MTVNPSTRSSPSLLASSLQRHGVSVLQTTPTHAKRLSPFLDQVSLLSLVLCITSYYSKIDSLKILVLGGEPFPSFLEVGSWIGICSLLFVNPALSTPI